MKKLFKLLFLLALPLSLAGCGKEAPVDNIPTKYIVLDKETINLEPTETYKLVPKALDKDLNELSNKVYLFNSSNPNVATINEEGLITALKAGTSTITCITDKQIASCLVVVSGSDTPDISGLSFDPNSVILKIGSSYTPNLKTYPEGITGINYAWNTSDEKVATASEGRIYAVGLGTASIYASYGSVSAKIDVTVDEKGGNVFTIALNKTSATLQVGGELDLVATCSEEATITWDSTDSGIASVDNKGHVTANSKGNTVISATANGQKATCQLTVGEGGDPSGDTNLEVYFYVDYNNVFEPEDEFDTSYYYAKLDWYVGIPFGNANKPADPATAPDPAFPVFVGWSSHPIIDNIPEDLWDFENDFVPDGTYVFTLYGIWIDA